MRHVLLVFLVGCQLGGTGHPGGDDDDGPGVDQTACAQAMADAPLAPAGYDFHDGIASAQRNRWDGVSMPQPGDAMYPGGRYRTLTGDSNGAMHPGCSPASFSSRRARARTPRGRS